MRKFLITLAAIPLMILLYFSPNIYGYLRFKSYCANEGGLRVYEQLERNVGWLADDYDGAHMAAQLKHVGFVRYVDKKDGKTYDLRYVGNDPQEESSFEKLPMDESKLVIYKWKNISEAVENELQLRRFGEQILDVNSSKILTYYYMFSYQVYNPARTFLSAPSREYCFHEPARDINEVSGWIKSLNTAFKIN